MTTDFKATQVQTNKIIVTGSFAGDGSNQLLIYNYAADDSGSPNQGQIDPSKFDTSSGIGSDVFLFVSGGVSTRSTGGSYGVTVMGGDLHISGNLTVDGTYPSGGGGGGGDVFWTSPVSDVVETTGSIRMDTNTTAGTYAVAVGTSTSASGNSSFAQGDSTVASGNYSHAEGSGSLASNDAAHAEGILTTASEEGSHAEGFSTTASGYASHAQGYSTTALGTYSHAEGANTTATGGTSHSEGSATTSSGDYSHAEGTFTTASGQSSHAEGGSTASQNLYTHAEGNNTVAGPEFLGYGVTAVDEISQAPDGIFQLDVSYGDQTPTIGNPTFVIGRNAGAFGFVTSSYDGFNTYITCSSGAPFSYSYTGVDVITLWAAFGSSAQGGANVGFGTSAHAEGDSTYSFGNAAHSEGQTTVAVGDYSHSEGSSGFAIGEASHAEGVGTTALGSYTHAEGDNTIARGYASHTEGLGTIASGSYQHAQGKYNLRNNDFSLFVIGDGTADDDASRSDILRVNSGSLIGSGSVEVTGSFSATLGLSGSLTQLTDGTSYLIAGNNITITSASNGAVTISSTGGGGLSTGKQHLTSYTSTTTTTPQVIGQFSWVPADYTGLTSVSVRAVLSTDGTTNHTGSIQIYNLTSGSFIDLIDTPATSTHMIFTGSTPMLLTSSNLLTGITNFNNSSTSVYEVRVSGSSANTSIVGGVEIVFS
jgi:hypothetical protein